MRVDCGTTTLGAGCGVELHENPYVGQAGTHRCTLAGSHRGPHHCPCGRLDAHCASAAEVHDDFDFHARLDLVN